MRSNSCDSERVAVSGVAAAVFEERGDDDGGTGAVIVAGGRVDAVAGGRL